ncbi:MAG: hydroxymethylpyrimidine/phosphomethylpyrimidine kinase [Chromatiaceae bacterium]|nr:hydroxymethylpyrimidine/phosphomethylpyrimidine kinase [Chromatiaceae bacterium]
MKSVPRILCIGGHDPSGGAGIQADIETVAALGGQALTLVTALTAQDTRNIAAVLPTPVDFFARQAEILLRDIRPDAIKIGLLGSARLIPVVRGLLDGFAGPVVLDPVLAAGGGFDLGEDDLAGLIREQLAPACTLLTPNRAEARRLTGLQDVEQAARRLLAAGTGAVLITAADEASGEQVENQLYTGAAGPRRFAWPRLAHQYHGSGCTLASACAANLALGQGMNEAVANAQRFTWQALNRATRPGAGQWLPSRIQ